MNAAIPLLILLVPFWVVTAGKTWDGQWIGLLAGSLALLAMQVKNLWARGFMWYAALWLLGSLVWFVALPPDAPFVSRALALQAHKGAGMLAVGCFMAGAIFIMAPRARLGMLVNVVLVLAALEVALAVLQSLGTDIVFMALQALSPAYIKANTWAHGSGGTMGNPNVISALVALALPFSWYYLHRYPLGYALAVVVGLAFCAWQATGTAILAIIGGMLVMGVLNNRNNYMLFGMAILGSIGVGWFLLGDSGINELLGNLRPDGSGARMITWNATVAAWWDTGIITGNGPGSWAVLWPSFRPPAAWWNWKFAHNDFLQLLFEMGLAGLTLVLGFIVSLARTAWAFRGYLEVSILSSVLVTTVILCLGSFTMHMAALAVIPLVAAARLEAYRRWHV